MTDPDVRRPGATEEAADEEPAIAEATDDHLDDIPDGAGCTEIWEHLSDRREADAERSHRQEADADD